MDFVSNDNNSIAGFFDAADRFVNYGALRRGHEPGVPEARLRASPRMQVCRNSVARRDRATLRRAQVGDARVSRERNETPRTSILDAAPSPSGTPRRAHRRTFDEAQRRRPLTLTVQHAAENTYNYKPSVTLTAAFAPTLLPPCRLNDVLTPLRQL